MTLALNASQLEYAVGQYEAAIAALEAANENLSVEQVLEVLVARDAVQAVMNDKTQPSSGRLIKKVKELDIRLKERAKYINKIVKLAEWEAFLNPSKKDWWLLDPITPVPPRDRYDWLWRFFSIILLTASLSLLLDISMSFLSGGPDTAGVFAIIIPSVLTLLTGGGALTKNGQEAIERILTSLNIDKSWWDEIICLLSALLLAGLILFWSLLPGIAVHYKNLGDIDYCDVKIASVKKAENCEAKLASAEKNYSRAIKLNSDYPEAHYKLGQLYEDLQDFDRASAEYQLAVKGGYYKAFNNLAHLYIQSDKKDKAEYYSRAFSLLRRGLELTERENDKETEYAMLTNLGWARLRQARDKEAEYQLRKAIALADDRAPAHCLLAQVLEKQGERKNAALPEWELCIKYANQNNPDEDTWLAIARQRFESPRK